MAEGRRSKYKIIMFAGLCAINSPHLEQFVVVDDTTSKLSAVCIMHVTWLAVSFDSLRGDWKMKAPVLNDASKGSV